MSINILELEENKVLTEEEITGPIQIEEEKVKYCLNCGTEVSDKFCPHCGQSTATPSKLKMKNFGKGVLMSFGRLTPGFFATAKGLLLHPWDVIRDHIHGKHIRYSPPITMVIQVFLYGTILYTFLDAILGSNLMEMYNFDEGFGYKGGNPILKMIDNSVVFQTLFMGIPICFSVYIGFIRHGAKKYNFAEYLAAFTYMYSSLLIYDLLLNLIYIIPGINLEITDYITQAIAIIFSVIILIKAFPQNKQWKTILLLVWSGFIGCIFIFIAYFMLLFIIKHNAVMGFFELFK